MDRREYEQLGASLNLAHKEFMAESKPREAKKKREAFFNILKDYRTATQVMMSKDPKYISETI